MISNQSRFLHVAFAFPLIFPAQQAAIEKALGMHGDWLRYAPNCWIVFAAHEPITLVQNLEAIPGMHQAGFLVAEIGVYAGRLDQKAWDWMNQFRRQ